MRDEELSAGEIAGHFQVTRPAVSQHLAVLKEAGLLTERRAGTRRLYRVRTAGLDELRIERKTVDQREHNETEESGSKGILGVLFLVAGVVLAIYQAIQLSSTAP